MLAAVVLTSGCAVWDPQLVGTGGGPLGTSRESVAICASGPLNIQCPDKGVINLDATSGLRQLLIGAQIPATIVAPATLVTTPPESVTFASSPGYAAELQRLSPAPAGRQWVGFASPALNYSTQATTPQKLFVGITWGLAPAADGSPFAGSFSRTLVLGIRNITQRSTADRPVACGSALTTVFDDGSDPGGPGGFVLCEDSITTRTLDPFDYGVVATSARASGAPGALVSLPFVVRNSNIDTNVFGPMPVTATTTLPGASAAVTPGTVSPPKNGDAVATAAVGIPPGARPGTYDVTLSLSTGAAIRTGVGKLTVVAGPAGGRTGGPSGGGAAAATTLKLTTVLPKGLSAAVARSTGIPVLIGATRGGSAQVRLLQGPARKPRVTVTKRVRLKVPGPVKVILRSPKLAKGPYRIVITVDRKAITRIGRLKA